MPVLELTTMGRKSGQKRSVMLTSPIQEGDVLVVIASRGGDDTHPAWFLNLQANPNFEVSLKDQPKRPMVATVAGADERARLWPKVVASAKNYGEYQEKTELGWRTADQPSASHAGQRRSRQLTTPWTLLQSGGVHHSRLHPTHCASRLRASTTPGLSPGNAGWSGRSALT